MVKRRRPGGFTLLEVMVASVVALVVLTAGLTTLAAVARVHRRQVETGRLKRAASMIMDQMVAELRQAGLGRPTKGQVGTGNLFPATIAAGTNTSLVFYTDLPRPNANFNGFSTLADDQTTSLPANGLAILNELNGNCDVYVSSRPCDTDAASLLFPPVAATGCHNGPDRLTCPWALKRYQGSENVIIVNGGGTWLQRQLTSVVYPTTPTVSNGTRTTLALNSAVPVGFFDGPPGHGYVTTPDRVFYALDTSVPNRPVIQRMQCWGDPLIPLSSSPCVPGVPAGNPDNTGWEELFAGNAPGTTLTFDYYNAAGTALPKPLVATDLPKVRRIGINLHLERAAVPGFSSPLTYDAFVSVSLRQ